MQAQGRRPSFSHQSQTSPIMNTQKLHSLLGNLSGHLVTDSPQQESELAQLQRLLARALLPEDVRQLKGSSFAFENADLFLPEHIPAERLDAIRATAEGAAAGAAAPEYRVFVREVPVRSTQLHASVPLWAGGAAVERTAGPFIRKDNRIFWFDFFKIEKLVALYLQGHFSPSLLFKVSDQFRRVGRAPVQAFAPLTSFKLAAGSIWIDSSLLAPGAPLGYYTGLTISGGTVKLGGPAQVTGDDMEVVVVTGTVTVDLQLKQPVVKDADESSPYGVDARAASVQLPGQLAFHFSTSGSTLDVVAQAQWKVYGHEATFKWDKLKPAVYDDLPHRILIPLKCSTPDFKVHDSQSPFHTVTGEAPIIDSSWALPAAPIDVPNPTAASGIGAILIKCDTGLTANWQGLRGGDINLRQPYLLAEPGRISISDLTAGNLFSQQTFKLWQDELNPHASSVQLQYPQTTPFFYFTLANGNELLSILGHADVQIDRPVTVAGAALAIRSKNSLLILAVSKSSRIIYLFDDNILADSIDFKAKPPAFPKPIALALHNALFKVTPVNGCVLFGQLAKDFVKVTDGLLYLTFGMYAYLPTLPDPYAANLGLLKFQFRGRDGRGPQGRGERAAVSLASAQDIWLWLVCQIKWQPAATADEALDAVETTFHFAPLQTTSAAGTADPAAADTPAANAHPVLNLSAPQAAVDTADRAAQVSAPQQTGVTPFAAVSTLPKLPNYGGQWDEKTQALQQDMFALLDVSTNADLLGVSFGQFDDRRLQLFTTHNAAGGATASGFPFQVQGLDVVSSARNVRAFTVPLISWEPVFNLTDDVVPGDPDAGFNYYPNDGGPTRIINNSARPVALAPIPLTDFLVSTFAHDDQLAALLLSTLPFGLKALALLQNQYEKAGTTRPGTKVSFNWKEFEGDLKGARQLQLDAGTPLVEGESNMFMGRTVQLNNVLEMNGVALGNSTLGASVTKIFNGEFMPTVPSDLILQRGVPLTRIDLSGYGATAFSNWLNPKATIAATSQARFDVFVGRCAHEIIQVKSLLYPWGIRVVRTITLFRTASNYVYRYDSGWQAESAGKYDFSYFVNEDQGGSQLTPVPRPSPYEIHPGVVKALYNVKEIKETTEIAPFAGPLSFKPGEIYVDVNGQEVVYASGDTNAPDRYELQPVYFNADVEIDNPISGYVTKNVDGQDRKLVPSKRILGFVQLAPRGMPLPVGLFKALIDSQQGSIGGPADCVVNIGQSGQQIRLNRFDVSNSFAANGSDPVFAAAGRGNVLLPKDGSWSMVRHEHGTGDVSPVPEDLSVPLIRIGKVIATGINAPHVPADPLGEKLFRIANPTELLRQPVGSTLNYGFLHSTDTQKALFLTPAFRQGAQKLLSKTPPLFADAFRIVNSTNIFPNVGDAVNNFGQAISLAQNGTEFVKNIFVNDNGKQVFELFEVGKLADSVGEAGYRLLKQAGLKFTLPDKWDLINLGSDFRIYIEYKANVQTAPDTFDNRTGALDFDINSFTNVLADKWKSQMSNVAIVVDLGGIDRLMTIKGNWDAKKGAEAQYRGGDTPDFPSPQIEFSPELQPVIDILEILQDLQGGDYKEAFQKGLKLAMSNKAGSWEYKFEAAKEIPVIRFPPGLLYNDPNAPLKLEAGLKLGAYFNAALKVTTDPSQLLPTAGGFLGFYGRLSVMCVSLSAATVYAVGQVNLDIAADTKVGPSLRMKFGFGAQIVVGLPVIGNVSLLYMVGVEIYLDAQTLSVSAFLLFQGHAEILGGLVSVTITIEAKGTVSKKVGPPPRTDLIAQVSFALEITVFWVIDITIDESWQEQRQIA
jgi:hypothetical protein